MSTKTTFKRIALVAVAALGFGLLSSVAPASATDAPATVGTPVVFGGTTGQPVVIAVPVTFASTTVAGDSVAVSAVLVARPTLSSNALNAVTAITATAAATATAADDRTFTTTTPNYSVSAVNSVNYAVTNAVGAGKTAIATSMTSFYSFTPNAAGTYQVAVFTDGGATVVPTGLIKSGDTLKYVTVTVADAPAVSTKLTVTAPGTFSTTGTNGAVVKVSALDAAGAVAKLNSGQMITLTIPSGLTVTTVTGASSVTVSKTNTQYGLVASASIASAMHT